MRYGNYSEGYNEGGYSEGYGRRGMKGTGPYSRYNGGRGSGRYRESYGNYPEEIMDEMKEQYMDYSEGREQYNRGNSYNGEEQMVQAAEGIMKSITKIVEELSQTDNPQVMQIIQRNAKKIMEM